MNNKRDIQITKFMTNFLFKRKREYSKDELKIMKNWNNGWVVESLETGNYFIEASKKIGFENSQYINITKNIIKTSKFMYISSYPAYIVDFVGRCFKKRNKYNKGNVKAARYQYLGLKNNLWEYGIFITNK